MRSVGGLAIVWKTNTNIKYFPAYVNIRFIGLKSLFGEICYLLLNVYLNYDHCTFESVIEYKESFFQKLKRKLLMKKL